MPRKGAKLAAENQESCDGKLESALQTPSMPVLTPAMEPDYMGESSRSTTSCPNPRADDLDNFQSFVRKSLTDLHRGQANINKRITQLENNINESIQFESRRIDDLEKRVKELESLCQHVSTIDKQLADHCEMLNKLERFSRRNNVRVIGFPQQKDEDCLIACSDELLTSQLTFCSVKAQRGTHCKDRKIKISLRSDDEVNAVNCSLRGH